MCAIKYLVPSRNTEVPIVICGVLYTICYQARLSVTGSSPYSRAFMESLLYLYSRNTMAKKRNVEVFYII